MRKEIILVCVTALVIAMFWLWQERYVFLINDHRYIAVGDRWTGCVDYSRVASRLETNPSRFAFEDETPSKEAPRDLLAEKQPTNRFGGIPVTDPPVRYSAPQANFERTWFGEMIRSEC